MNVAFMEYGRDKRYFHSCFIKVTNADNLSNKAISKV